jgi:hypothetical protein
MSGSQRNKGDLLIQINLELSIPASLAPILPNAIFPSFLQKYVKISTQFVKNESYQFLRIFVSLS